MHPYCGDLDEQATLFSTCAPYVEHADSPTVTEDADKARAVVRPRSSSSFRVIVRCLSAAAGDLDCCMAWKTQRRMTACTSKAAAANKLVWGHMVAAAAAAVVSARPLAKIWLSTSRKTVLAHVDEVTAVEAGPGCRAVMVAAVAATSSAVDLAAGFWN